MSPPSQTLGSRVFMSVTYSRDGGYQKPICLVVSHRAIFQRCWPHGDDDDDDDTPPRRSTAFSGMRGSDCPAAGNPIMPNVRKIPRRCTSRSRKSGRTGAQGREVIRTANGWGGGRGRPPRSTRKFRSRRSRTTARRQYGER